MKVWVLMDGNWDDRWIVAIYDNEASARNHLERATYLHIDEWDVLTHPVEQIAERLV